jgi:hypothetical protein
MPATTSTKLTAPKWPAAMEALILVATLGGPTMFARIGIMRAVNGHTFGSSTYRKRIRIGVVASRPATANLPFLQNKQRQFGGLYLMWWTLKS